MNHPQVPESPLFKVGQMDNRFYGKGFCVCGNRGVVLEDPGSQKWYVAHIAALEWRVAGRPDIAEQWEKWGSGEPWEPYPKVPESEFFKNGNFYPDDDIGPINIATATGQMRKLIAIVAMHECEKMMTARWSKEVRQKWDSIWNDWGKWGGLE